MTPKTTSKTGVSASEPSVEPYSEEIRAILSDFGANTGLDGVMHSIRPGTDGPRLLLEIAGPNELHYATANRISASLASEHPFFNRVVVSKRPVRGLDLLSPEARLFVRTLSSSLTADRFTSHSDFQLRYVETGSGAEEQVKATGNHIVFGRRGAGKSTLLVYALHHFQAKGMKTIWVDMQTFEKRNDDSVIADVLSIIAEELSQVPSAAEAANHFHARLKHLGGDTSLWTLESVRKLLPDLRRALQRAADQVGGTVIFLDDLHVVPIHLQPLLLSVIYSVSRSNRTSLKISALEHFTRPWDAAQRVGLEPPGDAQILYLDHNLTNPANAHDHIKKILDSLCRICGIPSVSNLLSNNVLPRLVWEAAGVPRDSLNILQKGIANSSQKKRKQVAITDINEAASSCLEDKLRYLAMDSSTEESALRAALDRVKDFCIKEHKFNAFVVALDHTSPEFQRLQKLVDLRFLHVLSAGFTRSHAGEKMIALLLDYGFYTGVRKARTVDVLQKQAGGLSNRELRKMPVLALKELKSGITTA